MITNNIYKYLLWLPIAAGLYLVSQANYPLYHSLAEIFSIIIACSVFIISWNSRKFSKQTYLLFVGVGYLFVAIVDITHTFAYKGIAIFPGYDSDLPTQLWISARYLESLTFLGASFFFQKRFDPVKVFSGYLLVVVLIFASIFWWDIFPASFIEGSGLTPFKRSSEYIICLFWGLAIFLLARRRIEFDRRVFTFLVVSMMISIASELAFTLYFNVFGIANFAGHFLKILSFYFVYRATLEINLTKPYMSMFRELKLNEMRFRNIYDTAPLAFVVWDMECRITDWNITAENMFGWSADEVLGRNFFEFLVPEKDRTQVEAVTTSFLNQTFTNHRSINENLTKDGRTIVCEWNSSVLPDGNENPQMVLSLALDITEKIKTEKALAEYSENIKKFAYMIVHDLKSPTASLHGLANLLAKKYGDVMDSKARMFCDQIMRVAEQVSALVENINIYIATKETPYHLETINVKEVLTLVREEFSSQLISRSIHWSEPESIPPVQADRIALFRVLRNFIDNALKYGGDTLTALRIEYAESDAHHILSLVDNGAGMNKEDVENIFDAFCRKNSAKDVAGSGLGLAIVKEIATSLGGTVWVESDCENGTAFSISINKSLTQKGQVLPYCFSTGKQKGPSLPLT